MNTISTSKPGWKSDMKNCYFWGMPHTETDLAAYQAAIQVRARALADGQFAAATAVENALDVVTRRSVSLLLIDLLFTALTLLLSTKAGAEQAALFMQLNRWAFVLALVGGTLLMTNLRLVWASDPASHYADPQAAFDFNMGIYKGRAWRYTLAWVLSAFAFACMLLSFTQMK